MVKESFTKSNLTKDKLINIENQSEQSVPNEPHRVERHHPYFKKPIFELTSSSFASG